MCVSGYSASTACFFQLVHLVGTVVLRNRYLNLVVLVTVHRGDRILGRLRNICVFDHEVAGDRQFVRWVQRYVL